MNTTKALKLVKGKIENWISLAKQHGDTIVPEKEMTKQQELLNLVQVALANSNELGADLTDENVNEELKAKSEKAQVMFKNVKQITQVYDRDKKESLQKETEIWLADYEQLNDEQKTPLAKHFFKMKEAKAVVDKILEVDNQITQKIEQIHQSLEAFLAIEDGNVEKIQKKAAKIKKAIEKIRPTIEKVKDKELLVECDEIVELLNY